jgi:hypothetical protein
MTYKLTIGRNRFEDNKLITYHHAWNKDRQDAILSVAGEPVKSTSSGDRWIVYTELETPLGNGRTHSRLEFWYKKDALQAIKYLQSLNVPEYKWR